MSDNQSYLYGVEFSIEEIQFFNYPSDLKCPDELDYLVRLQIRPNLNLDVTEQDYIDSVNCSKKVRKCLMFPMSCSELKCDPNACITAYKILCPSDLIACGSYRIHKLQCNFQEVKKKFDCQKESRKTSILIKEVVPLMDKESITGSIHYSLQIDCFGPTFDYGHDLNRIVANHTETDEFGRFRECNSKVDQAADECLEVCADDDDFDEYVASVNGNSLIVRVTKDHYVTRVFDSPCNDKLTIRGCDQQIDFKFPKFACQKNGDTDLTDFQKKIACCGSSYENSRTLPVIRGNLKYPGKFADQDVTFDVQDHCRPTDATEKYRVKPQITRNSCQQTSEGREGIEVCRKGCEDDTDVFLWKISQQRKSSCGKKNGIELEMRTPRGPKADVPKKESREVQVIEEEFSDIKRSEKKDLPSQKSSLQLPKNGKLTITKNQTGAVKKAPENVKKPQPTTTKAQPSTAKTQIQLSNKKVNKCK